MKTASQAVIDQAGAVVAVLDAESPSSAAIRDKLADLTAQREETLREIVRAEAFEAENLLKVDDAALEENDERLIRLRRQIARIDKLEAIGLEKLKAADDREKQERLVASYVEGQALVDEASAWILGPYVDLATKIRAGLARMIEIERLVDEVNGRLPDGRKHLLVEGVRKDATSVTTPSSLVRSVRLPAPQGVPDYWDEQSWFR